MCGLQANYNDTDPRVGYISVLLSFGPNLMDGVVDERNVTGYKVFLADDCNKKIGDVLHHFNETMGAYGNGCCDASAYVAQVNAAIPAGSMYAKLMVVPTTDIGDLTTGAITNAIQDLDDPFAIAATGAARRVSFPAFAPLALVAATLYTAALFELVLSGLAAVPSAVAWGLHQQFPRDVASPA